MQFFQLLRPTPQPHFEPPKCSCKFQFDSAKINRAMSKGFPNSFSMRIIQVTHSILKRKCRFIVFNVNQTEHFPIKFLVLIFPRAFSESMPLITNHHQSHGKRQMNVERWQVCDTIHCECTFVCCSAPYAWKLLRRMDGIETVHSWHIRIEQQVNGVENSFFRLLDVRPHFREAFRIVSANAAAVSANVSCKNLFPRVSAAPFLSYFLHYRFRERSAGFREACGNRKYVDVESRYEWLIYVEVAGLCHAHFLFESLATCHMVRPRFHLLATIFLCKHEISREQMI